MSGSPNKDNAKKTAVKNIIRQLHQGLSVKEARDRLVREVGDISSTEIAEIEQSLIDEGVSPDEIKKFCNVHALLFETALKDSVVKEDSPAHPVHLFKLENREIETITRSLRDAAKDKAGYGTPKLAEQVMALLTKLKGLEIHYTRKEQLLFPFLERRGFFGPSKVMWGKDNEVRDLLRSAASKIGEQGVNEGYANACLLPLVEEVEGMIFKEENILFPTSMEKLTVDDWVEILKESDEVGYAFIRKPDDTLLMIKELRSAVAEEPEVRADGTLSLPTGALGLKELMCVLNTLPVDITFVDKDDTVRYFSAGKDRIFVRTKSIIGRKVQNCHPPQSLEIVEKILASFKKGARDSCEFWINYMGRLVYIRYFAVRNEKREYLGTLEVTQDVSGIRKLEGEKRLLDAGI